MHRTWTLPQPFLLLIATNLALAGWLGWKWSLQPAPTWLAVQRSKAVFSMIFYDSMNDIKHFRTICITPQPCHSHFSVGCCQFGPNWMFGLKMELMACAYDSFNGIKYLLPVCITPMACHSNFCCWLLPIWPQLDFWDKNGAYGLFRLGWRYNRAKLSFYFPYMILSMIWNTSELSASHFGRATAIFVVDCCKFGPNWIFGLKIELTACANLVGGTMEQSFFFFKIFDDSINVLK